MISPHKQNCFGMTIKTQSQKIKKKNFAKI